MTQASARAHRGGHSFHVPHFRGWRTLIENPDPSVDARRIEGRLRAALTALATAEAAELGSRLDEVDRFLADLEQLLTQTRAVPSWPPDAEARLSVSRLEMRRLREGKVRRTEAIAKVRLLLPGFGRIGDSRESGERASNSG